MQHSKRSESQHRTTSRSWTATANPMLWIFSARTWWKSNWRNSALPPTWPRSTSSSSCILNTGISRLFKPMVSLMRRPKIWLTRLRDNNRRMVLECSEALKRLLIRWRQDRFLPPILMIPIRELWRRSKNGSDRARPSTTMMKPWSSTPHIETSSKRQETSWSKPLASEESTRFHTSSKLSTRSSVRVFLNTSPKTPMLQTPIHSQLIRPIAHLSIRP